VAETRLRRVLRYVQHHLGVAAQDGVTDGDLLARFAATRDEDAFATLLDRHGPMVAGVCRRLLGHDQDTEDVVQAAFLVLARKAGSIRKRESVGSWLYGVARRLALRCRAQRALRAARERAAVPAPAPSMAAAWEALQDALDEELQRLPERYRAPLILCYLEGQTHEEVSRQFGCPLGTVRSRVARGRDLLRTRLTRRGLTLSAAGFATTLAAGTAPAALSPTLANTTFAAVHCWVGQDPAAGAASPRVLALVDEVLRSMWIAKLKTVAALALAVLVLAGGTALAMVHRLAPQETPAAAPAPPPVAQKEQAAAADDPLPPGALGRLGTLRFRMGGPLSQDGTVVAMADFQQVKLVEVRTGKVVRQLKAGLTGTSAISSVTFSPDGKMLAVVCFDNNVRLLDVAGGELRAVLNGPSLTATHTLQLSEAVFSQDGKVVAVSSIGRGKALPVYAWDWASGKQLAPVVEREAHYARAALSPDGKVLATWEGPERLQLRDLAAAKPLKALEVGRPLPPTFSVAFAPDGSLLAVQIAPAKIDLWDVKEGKRIETLEGPRDAAAFVTVAFGPDGKLLAGGAADGKVALWDTATWQSVPAVGRTCALRGLVFPAPGTVLAHGMDGQAFTMWDVRSGEAFAATAGHRTALGAVVFAPGGKELLSVSQDGKLCHSDPVTGKELRCLQLSPTEVGQLRVLGPVPYCSFMALSPDGKYAAAEVAGIARVELWDDGTGQLVHSFPATSSGAQGGLAFSPDGTLLAYVDGQQAIHLWDVATKKELRRLNAEVQMAGGLSNVQRLAFSGDGRLLAGVSQHGNATQTPPDAVVWEVATGKEVCRVPQEFILCLALSGDGKVLALGTHKVVLLVRTTDGKVLRRLSVAGSPCALAFAPDGRTLACGYDVHAPERHHKICLWELTTGTVRCQFEGNQERVRALAFSRDGAVLAAGSDDTTVVLWDASGRSGQSK
jgi:RNA polymerase sigma factor (sigma-70 family)